MRATHLLVVISCLASLSSCFFIPMDQAVYGLRTAGEGKLPDSDWTMIDYSQFAGQTLWFYQDLKAGVPYDVRFADFTQGWDSVDVNGSVLDIKVTVYAADKTTVIMNEMDYGFGEEMDTVHRYTPSTDMRLYLKVTPKFASDTKGKFKIRCTPLTLLNDGVATSGTLIDSNYFTGNWYYYKSSTAATVKLDMTFPTSGYSQETSISAYDERSTRVFGPLNASAYQSPNSSTIDVVPNREYYIHVLPFSRSSSNLGNYSIAVSTVSTANWLNGTLGSWMNGEITNLESKVIYEYDVTPGTKYKVRWNDIYSGDGAKSLYGEVCAGSALTSVDDYFWPGTDGYANTRGLTAKSSKLFVLVQPNFSSYTGTFALMVAEETVLLDELGTLTSPGQIMTYNLATTIGTSYAVSWDDSGSGSGTTTVDVAVKAYPSGSPNNYYFSEDFGYNMPRTFVATTNSTVLTVVSPGYDTGTYKIKVTSP